MISDQAVFDCYPIPMQALFSEEGARRAGDAPLFPTFLWKAGDGLDHGGWVFHARRAVVGFSLESYPHYVTPALHE